MIPNLTCHAKCMASSSQVVHGEKWCLARVWPGRCWWCYLVHISWWSCAAFLMPINNMMQHMYILDLSLIYIDYWFIDPYKHEIPHKTWITGNYAIYVHACPGQQFSSKSNKVNFYQDGQQFLYIECPRCIYIYICMRGHITICNHQPTALLETAQIIVVRVVG